MLASSPGFKRGGVTLAVAVTVVLLPFGVGCVATAGKPGAGAAPAATVDPANRYKVSAPSASFYKLGPQQPGGPDLGLKQGTRLTVTRRSFGFSQVQLEDGSTGFVGTEDLTRLTPTEITAETAPPAPTMMNARPGTTPKPGATTAARRRIRPAPNIPIIPGDEPGLPAATDPTPRPGPVPTFRY